MLTDYDRHNQNIERAQCVAKLYCDDGEIAWNMGDGETARMLWLAGMKALDGIKPFNPSTTTTEF